MSYQQPCVLFAVGGLFAQEGGTGLDWQKLLLQVFTTIIFLIIGLAFFCLSDWLVERVLPRSLRKGIEEDKNVALAIVIAAVILGVALIVSAAIRGG